MKGQTTSQKRILHMSNNGLESIIYKEIQIKIRKTDNQKNKTKKSKK